MWQKDLWIHRTHTRFTATTVWWPAKTRERNERKWRKWLVAPTLHKSSATIKLLPIAAYKGKKKKKEKGAKWWHSLFVLLCFVFTKYLTLKNRKKAILLSFIIYNVIWDLDNLSWKRWQITSSTEYSLTNSPMQNSNNSPSLVQRPLRPRHGKPVFIGPLPNTQKIWVCNSFRKLARRAFVQEAVNTGLNTLFSGNRHARLLHCSPGCEIKIRKWKGYGRLYCYTEMLKYSNPILYND